MKQNIWEMDLPAWEVRFNILKTKQEYKFKIFDINNPKIKNIHKGVDNNFKYLIYNIKPSVDYIDEGIFSDENTDFGFPEKSFLLALMKRLNSQRDVKKILKHAVTKKIDAIVSFYRTRTMMEITNIELLTQDV